MSTNGKTLKFRAAKLKGFTVSERHLLVNYLYSESLESYLLVEN